MKRLFFLMLILPAITHAQRQIPTSPAWFIVDSDISVIPAFNAIVLNNANGFALSKVDSSAGAVTYTYKNSKDEKLDVWYKYDVISFPSAKTRTYSGVTAPNDVMIDFYNHY